MSRSNFRRVRKHEVANENEVRVSTNGRAREYIILAAELLLAKKLQEVTISGLKAASGNVVTIVDVLRRKIKGLHVEWQVQLVKTTDTYEATEEGLDNVVLNRSIPSLVAVLSFTAKNTSSPGYVAPLPDKDVQEATLEEIKSAPRRRTRSEKPDEAKDAQAPRQNGDRPRERRGRGRRGRGRGNNAGGATRTQQTQGNTQE